MAKSWSGGLSRQLLLLLTTQEMALPCVSSFALADALLSIDPTNLPPAGNKNACCALLAVDRRVLCLSDKLLGARHAESLCQTMSCLALER